NRSPSLAASKSTKKAGSSRGARRARQRALKSRTRQGRRRERAAKPFGVTRPKEADMCGIIGYIGSKRVVPILIDGLRRLEYRGYDSAGVAVVRNGAIDLRRSAGKLARLEEVIAT